MIREEAIEILKEIIDEGWLISDFDKCTAIDACEMAIEALGKETCEDCVRREDIIQNICESKECYKNECKGRQYKRCSDIQWVYDLPAVKPARKVGKWRKEYIGCMYDVCSECGQKVTTGYFEFKYCPFCGARMEGEE
jgi:hypothetical protein